MPLNFGHILDGPVHGLTAGIKYDVEFFRFLADAIKHGKTQELADLEAVAVQFVHEATDTATGLVKGNIGNLVIGAAMGLNSDPFAQSRHLMQAIETKYPKP